MSRLQCFRTFCCKGPPPPRPEYDVVCIGLTGSGKTSLLSRLCSEATDNIVPTTGFSIKAVPFQNAILNVKELGGADSIKKYWSRYYQGSQGVVFVLDSASSEEDLEVARTELHSALQHPQLCTLPFLILANHQDKPAARSVQDFIFAGFACCLQTLTGHKTFSHRSAAPSLPTFSGFPDNKSLYCWEPKILVVWGNTTAVVPSHKSVFILPIALFKILSNIVSKASGIKIKMNC
ncbi:hypothetical protein PO909_022313 [Leuciscus waleckii]